jgi:hypothetical protein
MKVYRNSRILSINSSLASRTRKTRSKRSREYVNLRAKPFPKYFSSHSPPSAASEKKREILRGSSPLTGFKGAPAKTLLRLYTRIIHIEEMSHASA